MSKTSGNMKVITNSLPRFPGAQFTMNIQHWDLKDKDKDKDKDILYFTSVV